MWCLQFGESSSRQTDLLRLFQHSSINRAMICALPVILVKSYAESRERQYPISSRVGEHAHQADASAALLPPYMQRKSENRIVPASASQRSQTGRPSVPRIWA